jgi:hypothetical protein
MKSFDLTSVGLFKHWSRPNRMHGPDGNDRQSDEYPDHPALRRCASEVNAAIDSEEKHENGGDALGHSGDLQLGPFLTKRSGEHLLPRNRTLRVHFDGDGQLGRWRLVAISHVAQMAQRGPALGSEGLAPLVSEAEEVGSEVHKARLHHLVFWPSTPFGVAGLLYSFDE